jgi:hypothetical protein
MIDSSQSKDDRALDLKRMIARSCEEKQVSVNFLSNRRESDLVTFTLHGHRDQVLMVPAKIEEALQDEDLELLGAKQVELDFLLQLVVTINLEKQKKSSLERRSKLIHR